MLRCDSLVFVYPTWWFNIPSILKGFFDRCFVPGVGFKYDPVKQERTVGIARHIYYYYYFSSIFTASLTFSRERY